MLGLHSIQGSWAGLLIGVGTRILDIYCWPAPTATWGLQELKQVPNTMYEIHKFKGLYTLRMWTDNINIKHTITNSYFIYCESLS